MTKCEQLRLRADLIEAAMKAVLQTDRRAIRFDEKFVDWMDDDWLDAHRSEIGLERLAMVKEISAQIEALL